MLPRHDRAHLRRDTGERLAGLSDGTGQQQEHAGADDTGDHHIHQADRRGAWQTPGAASDTEWMLCEIDQRRDHVREQRGGNQQEHLLECRTATSSVQPLPADSVMNLHVTVMIASSRNRTSTRRSVRRPPGRRECVSR
jgi:hypothetical protein